MIEKVKRFWFLYADYLTAFSMIAIMAAVIYGFLITH